MMVFSFKPKYALNLVKKRHLEDCKSFTTPFEYGIDLIAHCSSPKVDAILYWKLAGSLTYFTESQPGFVYLLGSGPFDWSNKKQFAILFH